jgi:RNA polymerase sigma-70 factor, ECF subfamily
MPEGTDTDARLLVRLRERDERAFNELVLAYELRIFRLVYRMLGRREEAEDMVQEVFVQVFKAVGGFRGESKLSTWIYRIAVNLCKNRSKYLARRKTRAQDELKLEFESSALQGARGVTAGEHAGPEQVMVGHQLEQQMKVAIAELEPDFREVLVLRDIEDLPYEEIMQITGVPEGTVKSRLHRARGMLRAKLEGHFGETLP